MTFAIFQYNRFPVLRHSMFVKSSNRRIVTWSHGRPVVFQPCIRAFVDNSWTVLAYSLTTPALTSTRPR